MLPLAPMAASNLVAHGAERDGAPNQPIPIKLGRELHTQMKTAASARQTTLKQLVHDVLGAWVVANGDGSKRAVLKRARAKSRK